MVSRFVEQQNFGRTDQFRGDRQALPPSARKCRRLDLGILKAHAAECRGYPPVDLVLLQA